MIDNREILEAASSFSLLPNTVEKDYVLGWMLAGIGGGTKEITTATGNCSGYRVDMRVSAYRRQRP